VIFRSHTELNFDQISTATRFQLACRLTHDAVFGCSPIPSPAPLNSGRRGMMQRWADYIDESAFAAVDLDKRPHALPEKPNDGRTGTPRAPPDLETRL
jgi:hypothetical protein